MRITFNLKSKPKVGDPENSHRDEGVLLYLIGERITSILDVSKTMQTRK